VTGRSQDPTFESGRVNQKRRTRAAIVAAARAIVDRGETPTIAQVADEALMTRTTVYRYFPTQESLLLEVSVTLSVAAFEGVLARPPDGTTPQQRLVEFVGDFNRFISENEAMFRNALRHYLDTWLATERAGKGHEEQIREGRRHAWISSALEPLRGTVSDDEMGRLVAALCLVVGGEAFTVLRDVCRLTPDEAIDVSTWAAQALLDAGLRG